MKQLKKQWFKIGALTLTALSFALVTNAQQTTGTVEKQTPANPTNGETGAVRVVDNKGTIKYMQSKNGITQFTSIAPTTGAITTTWQLGGKLTDSTFIDATGTAFALDGIKLVSEVGLSVSTNAVGGTKRGDGSTGTGYTFLVRNEATGETMKLKASELVTGGQSVGVVGTTTGFGTTSIKFTDATLPTNVNKVSVYRNGIKLVAATDYLLAETTPGAGTYEVTVNIAGGTDPDDYAVMTGDKIEIQWVN